MAEVARRRRLAAPVKLPSSTTVSSTKSWSTLGVPGACISNFLKRAFNFIRIFLARKAPIFLSSVLVCNRRNRGQNMLKVGLIVGSTRPNRCADTPVQWLVERASARRDLPLAVLDLRDPRMPCFNYPAYPPYTGGLSTIPA